MLDGFDALFDALLAEGRVSEADFDRATDQLASGEKSEAELCAEWQPFALRLGADAVIRGLKARADLNGERARVVSFQLETGRFGVRLGTGESIAVRAQNLVEQKPGQEAGPSDLVGQAVGSGLPSDMVEAIAAFLTCTRCGEKCAPGSKCRVPHPMHLRQELGSMLGGGVARHSFGCGACLKQYTRVRPWDSEDTEERTVDGPEYCYDGAHTTQPLPSSDRRRVFPHSLALVAGPTLRAELAALPADLQVLTITAAGFYDDSEAFVLEPICPELVELQARRDHG